MCLTLKIILPSSGGGSRLDCVEPSGKVTLQGMKEQICVVGELLLLFNRAAHWKLLYLDVVHEMLS
jgi:hypothetical protein